MQNTLRGLTGGLVLIALAIAFLFEKGSYVLPREQGQTNRLFCSRSKRKNEKEYIHVGNTISLPPCSRGEQGSREHVHNQPHQVARTRHDELHSLVRPARCALAFPSGFAGHREQIV